MSFLTQANLAIRQTGGRMTHQREIILKILAESDELLDAEGLYQLACAQDSSISLATVYRTLSFLQEVGLVQERYVSKEHQRRFYEVTSAIPEYMFTCSECHQVIPFRTELIEMILHDLERELGVRAFNACICISGLCPTCLAQKDEI